MLLENNERKLIKFNTSNLQHTGIELFRKYV